MAEYKTPLPKGASKKVINLSKEVDKWANMEMILLFQVDDLEMIINELDEDHKGLHTLKTILREKEFALKKAEAEYGIALHNMCEAMENLQ